MTLDRKLDMPDTKHMTSSSISASKTYKYTGVAATRIRSTATKAELVKYEAEGLIPPAAPKAPAQTKEQARQALIDAGMGWMLD